jgi:hypothetical protein
VIETAAVILAALAVGFLAGRKTSGPGEPEQPTPHRLRPEPLSKVAPDPRERCAECGYVSAPFAVALHRRRTGHSGSVAI